MTDEGPGLPGLFSRLIHVIMGKDKTNIPDWLNTLLRVIIAIATALTAGGTLIQ